MANWNVLKAAVANIINANGNQEITGQLLQNVLNNIITNVGENATFAGIATLDTNPGAPDGPVFYLATTAGVYPNFNGIEVQDGEAVIFLWDNNAWSKKVTGFATQEKLSQLGSEVKGIVGGSDEILKQISIANCNSNDYYSFDNGSYLGTDVNYRSLSGDIPKGADKVEFTLKNDNASFGILLYNGSNFIVGYHGLSSGGSRIVEVETADRYVVQLFKDWDVSQTVVSFISSNKLGALNELRDKDNYLTSYSLNLYGIGNESQFGKEEEKILKCIKSMSITSVSGTTTKFRLIYAGHNGSRILFLFQSIDETITLDPTFGNELPSGVRHYKNTDMNHVDYIVSVVFDWDAYKELFTNIYSWSENGFIVLQSTSSKNEILTSYMKDSKIGLYEQKILSCFVYSDINDIDEKYFILLYAGYNVNNNQTVFIVRSSDEVEILEVRKNELMPSGVVEYTAETNNTIWGFAFDWDAYKELFTNRYESNITGSIKFKSSLSKFAQDLALVKSIGYNSGEIDSVNIKWARCISELKIELYDGDMLLNVLQCGHNVSNYRFDFYFRNEDTQKVYRFLIRENTERKNGIEHIDFTNDLGRIVFDFDWDKYNAYFPSDLYRPQKNFTIYASKLRKEIIDVELGESISLKKGSTVLLSGASIALDDNGWFPLVCMKNEIIGINKSIGGSNIINNLAAGMLDANGSQPHGSVFMVNGVDIFDSVDALIISHIHNQNVLLDEDAFKRNTIEYYKQNGVSTYAEAFDYVIKQYKQWCAEKVEVIQETINDVTIEKVVGTKLCQIMICSYWLPSRIIYANSSRLLAKRFNLAYANIDKSIGVSGNDFVRTTASTDDNVTPTLGYYNPSVLMSQFVNTNGSTPIGKTETIDGVIWGWHPLLRSKNINYGLPKEDDGYYYPSVQYKIASVVGSKIKTY